MPDTATTVARLVAEGHLQRVPGRSADAPAFLAKAREHLDSATRLLPDQPTVAVLAAFSAVRSALLGVLARHDIAVTDTAGDRSDRDNDDAIVAAVTELAGGDRFPGLHELRAAYEAREYGPDSPRSVTAADAERWVSAAAGIVDTAAEELATG